jgi:hypothetical protein
MGGEISPCGRDDKEGGRDDKEGGRRDDKREVVEVTKRGSGMTKKRLSRRQREGMTRGRLSG